RLGASGHGQRRRAGTTSSATRETAAAAMIPAASRRRSRHVKGGTVVGASGRGAGSAGRGGFAGVRADGAPSLGDRVVVITSNPSARSRVGGCCSWGRVRCRPWSGVAGGRVGEHEASDAAAEGQPGLVVGPGVLSREDPAQ